MLLVAECGLEDDAWATTTIMLIVAKHHRMATRWPCAGARNDEMMGGRTVRAVLNMAAEFLFLFDHNPIQYPQCNHGHYHL